MEFNKAFQSAKGYFAKGFESKIAHILETDTHWIFYPGEKGVRVVGGYGIKIDKATGKIEDFILPNAENFKLLEKAKEIEL